MGGRQLAAVAAAAAAGGSCGGGHGWGGLTYCLLLVLHLLRWLLLRLVACPAESKLQIQETKDGLQA